MGFTVHRSKYALWGGALAAVAGLGVASLPAMAQSTQTVTNSTGPCTLPNQAFQLELANPSPGDSSGTGQFALTGYAYDKSATSGSGIDSVTISLGSQDSGGQSLGNVVLGTPNPRSAAGSQFANSGFTITQAQVPDQSGNNTIFVYAHSTVSGQTAVLQVPIQVIGSGQSGTAPPTPTGGPWATCTPPVFAAAATATPVPAAPSSSQPCTSTQPCAPAQNVTPGGVPLAADGQSLYTQPPTVQAQFTTTWGSNAAQEWANEHNAAIGAAH